MSMIELNNEELAAVSGSGTFLGDALINGSNVLNGILNTPFISSFGNTLSKFGAVGRAAHQLPDTGGYLVFKSIVGIGQSLGGTVTPNYHYEKEQGEGLYFS